MVQLLEHCTVNLQVMGSNTDHICVCVICFLGHMTKQLYSVLCAVYNSKGLALKNEL